MTTEREATVDSLVAMPGIPPLSSSGQPRASSRPLPHPMRLAWTAGDASMSGPFDATLGRRQFLQILRREERRADRTHSPLSVIIYQVPDETILGFVKIVVDTVRETDVVGCLGDHTLAVLCSDTGADGAKCLAQKIGERAPGFQYTLEIATHPDHLLERMKSGAEAPTSLVPMVSEPIHTPKEQPYRVKRLIDVLGAAVAIVLFSPVMLVTALAVALTSRGPVIFKQQRLGRGGVPFVFYKFRSMRVDNDDSIHRKYVQSLISGDLAKGDQQKAAKPQFKIKRDPRVTRVGQFIRKYSIDELPQLFNVLKGDMSLVGPRPPIPYEATNYRSWHLRRVLEIQPGITGIWQTEGRSKVTFDEMVRMDLRYIRDCSLKLDLSILAKTALVVLRCDGAS